MQEVRLMEVETQTLLVFGQGYLESAEKERLLAASAEIGKILNGLLNSLSSHK